MLFFCFFIYFFIYFQSIKQPTTTRATHWMHVQVMWLLDLSALWTGQAIGKSTLISNVNLVFEWQQKESFQDKIELMSWLRWIFHVFSVLHFRWREALAAFIGEDKSLFAVRRIRTEHHNRHIAFDIFNNGRRDGAAVPLTHLVVQHVIHRNVVIPEKN